MKRTFTVLSALMIMQTSFVLAEGEEAVPEPAAAEAEAVKTDATPEAAATEKEPEKEPEKKPEKPAEPEEPPHLD